jgi:predicted AAA+ superfamily ATPase
MMKIRLIRLWGRGGETKIGVFDKKVAFNYYGSIIHKKLHKTMHHNAEIVERTQFNALKEHLDEKEITLILGPRQVGKTTLMLELKDYLFEEKKIPAQNIYYFNLDLTTDFDLFTTQKKFVEFLRDRTKHANFIYVFIDEAQRIGKTGLFLKGVYDLGLPLKMVLSGSSTLELKKKLQEPLTGRKKIFKILPFSFDEFLTFKDDSLRKIIKNSTTLLAEEDFKMKKYLEEYLLFGGYPRVVIEREEEKKKGILEEIYNSYIDKDIVRFLKIRDPLSFSNFVRFLANQNGTLLSISHTATTLNINQRTLVKYLYYLEQTFVIRKLTPFFTNPQKEIVKMPKIYFLDTGLRNFACSNFSKLEVRGDRGELLENFVLGEINLKLKLSQKVNFWRGKDGRHEVDFIVRTGMNIIPIEVKTKKEDAHLSFSYKSFLEQYRPKKGIIVLAYGREGKINQKACGIELVIAYKLPWVDLD